MNRLVFDRAKTIMDGEQSYLCIAVPYRAARQFCAEMKKNRQYVAELKEFREKRSLNSNSYAWCLLTKIADVVRADKDAIYFQMLKRYGQSEMVSVLAHIPIEEYVRYSEYAGESTLNGKLFKHYRVYKGSSEFDTREMSVFLDGVVSEAQELGIETRTPAELAKMKEDWKA